MKIKSTFSCLLFFFFLPNLQLRCVVSDLAVKGSSAKDCSAGKQNKQKPQHLNTIKIM